MTQYERTYINSELCVALLALYEGTDEFVQMSPNVSILDGTV